MLDRLGRQIYHPALMLPLLALMQLMVMLDFNFGQLALVLVSKGMRYVVRVVFHRTGQTAQPDAPMLTCKRGVCGC
jgi:hypothetical protein